MNSTMLSSDHTCTPWNMCSHTFTYDTNDKLIDTYNTNCPFPYENISSNVYLQNSTSYLFIGLCVHMTVSMMVVGCSTCYSAIDGDDMMGLVAEQLNFL